MTQPEPIRRQAGHDETGKYCPYCRFPLKEKTEVVACGVCGSSHHEDCWAENGGCAVVACEGGPQAETAAAASPPPSPAPAEPRPPAGPNVPPPSAPSGKKVITVDEPAAGGAGTSGGNTGAPPAGPRTPPGQPAPGRSSSDRNLILAFVAVVAVGLIGVFLIVQAFGGSDGEDPVPTAETSQPAPAEADAETTADEGPGGAADSFGGPSGPLAGMSRSEIQQGAQRVIRDYHVAIHDGDRSGMWNALSRKKRQQKIEEDRTGDYEDSLANFYSTQFEFGSQLDSPESAKAKVLSIDRRTGAVDVYVSGLGYNGSCNAAPPDPDDLWTGITWVRYENGHWGYEPGYSTTQQRRERWENAPDDYRLLGFGCNPQ